MLQGSVSTQSDIGTETADQWNKIEAPEVSQACAVN